MQAKILITLSLLTTVWKHGECVLKLSEYFSDHMVLQRGPKHAVIWGTGDTEGDTVTIKVVGQNAAILPVITKVSHGQWKAKLAPVTLKGPFIIDVSSKDGHVILNDVLFGDVWICSGQSNMGFTLGAVINATQEIQHALQFKDIRFVRANLVESPTPRTDFGVASKWAAPNNHDLSSFSAVCWLFAEYLYPHLNYPLGMVESAWGGTQIEAWSPPEAINDCSNIAKRGPISNSVIWNAMINPIVSSTIYGVLWYQGENNSQHSGKYGCQIQALINRWRSIFYQNSLGETSKDFPFGYVQLAPHNAGDFVGSFPYERWAQTHSYGYSPNPALPETFMAVAMDLPDFASPSGTIHPRYKQDVAARLVRGALNIAYGHKDVIHQGPFPTGFVVSAAEHTLTVEYDHGKASLVIKTGNNTGFEVCCGRMNANTCNDGHDPWVLAPITKHDTSHVTISTTKCAAQKVVGLRYEWRTSPCALRHCTLYAADSSLPAPPYMTLSLPA